MKNSLKDKSARSISFTRRAFILGGLQAGILGILGGRLAWLQIEEGQKYKTLAEKNRINVKILSPSRGKITDRFGVPLAINRPDFRVLILPEQTEDLRSALDQLRLYINVDNRDIQEVLKKSEKSARFVPIEIRGSLSREEVAQIEVNLPDLPGILTEKGEKRNYPFSEATAHIVGYVGAVTREDLRRETSSPLLKVPGFRVGKSGIEKTYDRILRGQPGTAEMEVNVVGREVRKLAENPSRSGQRVTLTIDGALQRFSQLRLQQERSASAVIMDIYSGAVYAMASTPSFNPNLFVDGISVEQWEELLANPANPLNNKAISGQYPPGSTFKMLTALAALEGGHTSEDKHIFCPGYLDLGRDRFHCWKRGGHGSMNVVSAIEESCDVFFYKLATEIGIQSLADMSRLFGLGEKTGIELDQEKPGLVPTRTWKLAKFGADWQPGETIVASIGQGYILTTPLQLAVMTARLLNGGLSVEPRITGAIGNERLHYPDWPSFELQQKNLDLVKQGMVDVMEGPKGTARASQIPEDAMKMGGKTGTSQVKRITRAQRLQGVKNEDLPWKDRHHALFVGFAPLHEPRYVCSVVVEHGVSGSKAAAPLCRDLLYETQKRNPHLTEVSLPNE